MRIELERGITVETATQADIDEVEDDFREGERREQEAFGGGRTPIALFESCWAVRHWGNAVGYCGVAVPARMTAFAPTRWLCYMSCTYADRIKLDYVRMSRKVMKAIVAEIPAHVTRFLSLPAESYRGSIRWHERVLRMRRIGRVPVNGEDFALFETTRKEIER